MTSRRSWVGDEQADRPAGRLDVDWFQHRGIPHFANGQARGFGFDTESDGQLNPRSPLGLMQFRVGRGHGHQTWHFPRGGIWRIRRGRGNVGAYLR